ncbi:MAG: DUF4097 domain-containing protein [Anaerolineae bacterium]|nr:DUF4097 domain-containing protein [Anaerolineae bacterium]
MSYALPEMPVVTESRSRGCFLFSPLGCIFSAITGIVGCGCLAIVGPIVGLGALLALLFTTGQTRTGSERVPLENVMRLEVVDDVATVTLRSGPQNAVLVDYSLTAYGFSGANARANLANMRVVAERRSDGTIGVYLDDAAVDFSFYDLSLEITVPRNMERVFIEAGGDVRVEGVSADFEIFSDGDDLTLQDVEGRFVLQTDLFGGIVWSGSLAPDTQNRIETDSGDVRLTFLTRPDVALTVNTRSGRVEGCPEQPAARLRCETMLGGGGAALDVDTGSGIIRLSTPR